MNVVDFLSKKINIVIYIYIYIKKNINTWNVRNEFLFE